MMSCTLRHGQPEAVNGLHTVHPDPVHASLHGALSSMCKSALLSTATILSEVLVIICSSSSKDAKLRLQGSVVREQCTEHAFTHCHSQHTDWDCRHRSCNSSLHSWLQYRVILWTRSVPLSQLEDLMLAWWRVTWVWSALCQPHLEHLSVALPACMVINVVMVGNGTHCRWASR